MGAPATPVHDFGKLLLRLAIGGMLILHGIFKLSHGIDFLHQMLAAKGLPDILTYGVYLGEIVGPALIILGLFTRLGAIMVLVNMVFAVYLAKLPAASELTKSGGWAIELEALYAFGALALVFLGSGRFALSRGRTVLD
jgi:putative oxidoreductase